MRRQVQERKEPHRKEAGRLRMRDLVAATGMPKSTLLHYVAAGLLPKPAKTSRNMAYYDPACVDRVRLIRHLQQNHRLTLEEIKTTMAGAKSERELQARLALNEVVFGTARRDRLWERRDFCAASGLTEGQLDELVTASLLVPLQEGHFDDEDLEMARAFAQAFSWGLRPRDFQYYVRLGEQLVDHDVALRRHVTRRLSDEADAVLTMSMAKNGRLARAYIFERLFRRRVAAMRNLKDA